MTFSHDHIDFLLTFSHFHLPDFYNEEENRDSEVLSSEAHMLQIEMAHLFHSGVHN